MNSKKTLENFEKSVADLRAKLVEKLGPVIQTSAVSIKDLHWNDTTQRGIALTFYRQATTINPDGTSPKPEFKFSLYFFPLSGTYECSIDSMAGHLFRPAEIITITENFIVLRAAPGSTGETFDKKIIEAFEETIGLKDLESGVVTIAAIVPPNLKLKTYYIEINSEAYDKLKDKSGLFEKYNVKAIVVKTKEMGLHVGTLIVTKLAGVKETLPTALKIQDAAPDLDDIKIKLENYFEQKVIPAEVKKEDEGLLVEHNLELRKIKRFEYAGKHADAEVKEIIEERLVPAKNGFRISIWITSQMHDKMQVVYPQEISTYGPDNELVSSSYSGDTHIMTSNSPFLGYTIVYGTKVPEEFIKDLRIVIESYTKATKYETEFATGDEIKKYRAVYDELLHVIRELGKKGVQLRLEIWDFPENPEQTPKELLIRCYESNKKDLGGVKGMLKKVGKK